MDFFSEALRESSISLRAQRSRNKDPAAFLFFVCTIRRRNDEQGCKEKLDEPPASNERHVFVTFDVKIVNTAGAIKKYVLHLERYIFLFLKPPQTCKDLLISHKLTRM